MTRNPRNGFTLIELMISVAILAVLASVAVTGFRKYILRSQLAEVPANLSAMHTGALAYYAADHFSPQGQPVSRQFPSQSWVWAPTPMGVCCIYNGGKCPVWPQLYDSIPEFNAIGFTITEPARLSYSLTVNRNPAPPVGSLVGDRLYVQAIGDLDCSGPPWTNIGRYMEVRPGSNLESSGLITFYAEAQ